MHNGDGRTTRDCDTEDYVQMSYSEFQQLA